MGQELTLAKGFLHMMLEQSWMYELMIQIDDPGGPSGLLILMFYDLVVLQILLKYDKHIFVSIRPDGETEPSL